MTEEQKKKKGFLNVVWESMTKTGGCCGPGEDCCGPAPQKEKPETEKKKEESASDSCCSS